MRSRHPKRKLLCGGPGQGAAQGSGAFLYRAGCSLGLCPRSWGHSRRPQWGPGPGPVSASGSSPADLSRQAPLPSEGLGMKGALARPASGSGDVSSGSPASLQVQTGGERLGESMDGARPLKCRLHARCWDPQGLPDWGQPIGSVSFTRQAFGNVGGIKQISSLPLRGGVHGRTLARASCGSVG